ncbi:MAG: hypothetical protein HYS18_02950 [Burkholderiales bacterium]|nr:hypothetical protein [Burkholderiales bacterium]
MRKALSYLAGFAAVFSFAAAFAAPPTVDPEGQNLDVDLSAKIAKEKSKAKKVAAQSNSDDSGSSSSSSSGCGTVNINSSDSKKSNSGIKDIMGKQTTTIVTGPVINMASCK